MYYKSNIAYMLINLIEVNAEKELLAFIEQINKSGSVAWGVLMIKRTSLKEISNNAFVLAIKPALMDAVKAEVFFLSNDEICIAWSGMPAQISRNLQQLITTTLFHDNSLDNSITYYDPQVMGNELAIVIKERLKTTAFTPNPNVVGNVVLECSAKQTENFKRARKAARQRLNILIVEDQAFTRKLLYDVLKNTYDVSSAESVAQAWQLYLKTAPDIVFLDIELSDASGHLLAAKIHEIDPAAFVIMVTANNSIEDVQTAKQNQVAGFIAKPYSKQKISEAIEKYNKEKRK